MKIETCTKSAFSVVGKEGSTLDGPGFIQKLWAEANARFREVQPLAKKDGTGNLAGIWGVMSDFSRSFQPWEDHFSKGLYLAEEGCLSLQGQRRARRHRTIKVQWQDRQMQTHVRNFTGWTAQIIQHEIDHCSGILI